MAGRGPGKSWLFLLLVLAVPGLFFYNMWKRVSADYKDGSKRTRQMPLGGVFQDAGKYNKLVNPLAPEKDTEEKLLPAKEEEPSGQEPSAASGQASVAAASAPVAASSRAVSLASPAVSAPAEAGLISTAPASFAARTDDQAVLTMRNPMISPYDTFVMQQQEIERALREQELHDQLTAKKRVKREPPIESTLDLQGIVATPDEGNKAIINNEMFAAGDMVGKVKILKITTQSVVFQYKQRKFTKSVSR